MQITHKLNLKTTAILLKVLPIFLFVGFFLGHSYPQSLMLRVSAILWFAAQIVNLFIFL